MVMVAVVPGFLQAAAAAASDGEVTRPKSILKMPLNDVNGQSTKECYTHQGKTKEKKRLAFSENAQVRICFQSYEDEITARDQQIKELSEQIVFLSKQNEKKALQVQNPEDLALQNQLLRGQLQNLKKGKLPESEVSESLKKENALLHKQVKEFLTEITFFKEQQRSAQAQIDTLTQENLSLKSALSQLTEENASLTQKASEYADPLPSLKCQELELALHAAQETIRLNAERLNLEIRKVTVEKERNILELQKKIDLLQSQLESLGLDFNR